jgi:DNA-binding PadR family transcriptional regulator
MYQFDTSSRSMCPDPEVRVARRSAVLEFAVLGLLHESPMHGYELRKRLNGVLGSFRAISYGSLYPCLKELLAEGLIAEDGPVQGAPALSGKRAKIVYALTAEGKERFQQQLEQTGPETWDDEPFAARLAFFGRTDADVRLRILEGRRSRLEERTASLRQSLSRTRERMDTYTLQLQQHGLEREEREVRWLSELIENESQNVRRDRAGESQQSGSGRRPSTRG